MYYHYLGLSLQFAQICPFITEEKRFHMTNITANILYTGVNDKTIDLFEGQYPVPNGISYNSYVIMDDKIAIMDTADSRKTEEWLSQVETALQGRQPDYVIVLHMEPDHSGSLETLLRRYPQIKVVGNAKTFQMISQFFPLDISDRTVTVKEGDTLPLGKHTLQFIMAPMVHWPEVMFAYEQMEKVLFAADAFGKFGALDTQEDWLDEARRYYFNIVGKYGVQVQAILKKAASLDIRMICPLHGPVLKENLGYYLEKYQLWSSYIPEDSGVTIAYASIYGHTAAAAEKLAETLKAKGAEHIALFDLNRCDMSKAVESAFHYDKLVLASATYNMDLFPSMEAFLHHLTGKNYQNRTIGIIENGTWAPAAAKQIKELLSNSKNLTLCNTTVTVKSALNADSTAKIETLAEELLSV